MEGVLECFHVVVRECKNSIQVKGNNEIVFTFMFNKNLLEYVLIATKLF